ncbi:hypothetical protein D3C87_1993190 [compost metagenome]
MVCGNLNPDRCATIRVDGKLYRRLAPAGAPATKLFQESLAHQFIDDIGDRLGCEMRDLG